MSDLISRKEAIEWVQNILATHLYYHPRSKSRNVPIDEVIDRLERVPSIDAVQVVRCKDCKYHEQAYQGAIWCDTIEAFADENWFCATGERKEP